MVELVEAGPDDVETLVECWYELAREMERYSELNALAYADVDEVDGDGFRDHLERDDVGDYLLREDDETLGFVTLQWGRHPSREYSEYVRIVNLFVKARYRNEGYGTAAIDRVKERAREGGCDHLKVGFEAENEGARRFYERGGFEEKRIEAVHRLR